MANEFKGWTEDDARNFVAIPKETDDKYLRGVLGVITGSVEYPGSAVLGVDAALRTGVGMLRYFGPEVATSMVLARRPESVTVEGKVQAWLIGSGIPDSPEIESGSRRIPIALESGVPLVLDAGGLALVSKAVGPKVLTPHAGELSKLLGQDIAEIKSNPQFWVQRASETLSATVVLKGNSTWISGPGGNLVVKSPTTWLATAGTGDSLAGITGALLATHSREIESDERILATLAATAVVIHGLAGAAANSAGPFTVLELNESIPSVIAKLIS
ncbi:MAG: NAD(P)H-hydrate dehydratase [Microbacteriaceae bacterium]|nr:NAD(P)H-hydrate dehydratase [Microbacteriaceae bacterium]